MQAVFAGLRYGNRRLRGTGAGPPGCPPRGKVQQLQTELNALRKKHALRPPWPACALNPSNPS